jgi:hypothetical protein
MRGDGLGVDPVDARRFVFQHRPAWSFYLRYFDPVSLIRNIQRQARDRATARAMGFAIEFTPYGDGPLDTTRNRGLFYGKNPGIDAGCFDALRSLAVGLSEEGRRFMVVTTPLHPAWTAHYDADGSLQRHISGASRLRSTAPARISGTPPRRAGRMRAPSPTPSTSGGRPPPLSQIMNRLLPP